MNLRNLAIWGVIIVVLIGLYSMVTGGGKAASASDITYSQLLQKVNAGQVRSAEFRGPQMTVTDNANKPFTAVTPSDQQDLTKRLEAECANISFKSGSGMGILGFVLNSLP